MLPQPSSELLAHSAEVAAAIHAEIAHAGGWIPFSRYMEIALYAPGLGYYAAGLQKFGAGGDFVTAPEISPLFGQTLARQVSQVLRLVGGDVLELGAGTGRLAVDILKELLRLDVLPGKYRILEVSAHLRDVQKSMVARELPANIAERFEWLDALPSQFNGCVLGNEVLDALPVEVVARQSAGMYERGVTWKDGRFLWQESPMRSALLESMPGELPVGMTTEVCPAASALIASLSERLERGAMLFIDYGFPRHEYYHPQREGGTLMCHYQHHAHDDPFLYPGLQDITAHVDFTSVAESAVAHGLQVAGYTTQAQFLINAGITEILSRTSPNDLAAYLPRAAEAQKLLSPAEMGELFKVIALTKGRAEPLAGFARGDKRHTL